MRSAALSVVNHGRLAEQGDASKEAIASRVGRPAARVQLTEWTAGIRGGGDGNRGAYGQQGSGDLPPDRRSSRPAAGVKRVAVILRLLSAGRFRDRPLAILGSADGNLMKVHGQKALCPGLAAAGRPCRQRVRAGATRPRAASRPAPARPPAG